MAKNDLFFKIPSITIGIAGTAMTAYNIINNGNIASRRETKQSLGDDYLSLYTNNLSSSKASKLTEKLKKYTFFNVFMDNSFYPLLLKSKNHVINWGKETVENILPLSLSVGAIFAPTLVEKYKKGEIKPMIQKCLDKIDRGYNRIGSFIVQGKLIKPLINAGKRLFKAAKKQRIRTLIAAGAAAAIIFITGKYLLHDIIGIAKNKQY